MNKAEKIMNLLSDQYLINNDFYDENFGFAPGVQRLCSNLRKQFQKHIESFAGKTRFLSKNSIDEIEKILSKSFKYWIRKTTKEEKHCSMLWYQIIKAEFNDIKKGK